MNLEPGIFPAEPGINFAEAGIYGNLQTGRDTCPGAPDFPPTLNQSMSCQTSNHQHPPIDGRNGTTIEGLFGGTVAPPAVTAMLMGFPALRRCPLVAPMVACGRRTTETGGKASFLICSAREALGSIAVIRPEAATPDTAPI